MTNDYSNEADTVGNALDTVFLKKNQGSNNAGENVVTDANGDITTEAKPNIPTGSSTATDITMNGSQSAGLSNNFARADHIHPHDTSKLDANLNSSNSGKYLKVDTDGSIICDAINIGINSGIFREIDRSVLNWNDFVSYDDYDDESCFVDYINSEYYEGSFTENDIEEGIIYLIWRFSFSSQSNYRVLVTFKKINNEWYYRYLGNTQYFDINSYALYTHTHNNYLSRYTNDLGFVKTNDTHVGFGTTQGTVAEGNHTHSYNDLNNKPPIIEEIPFYWIDDFLTYASNSYNIFYDPNNDVQYLINFIDSNDNDSGFTSDNIKTDRLYQIPYGSSYTHDICVAFTYDETNEEYNAHYVTTNERYATLYELSLKLNANLGTSNSGKYLKVDSDGSIICDVVSGGSNSVTTSTVTNSTSLPNLGGTFSTQDAINRAIDSQIGTAITYINL